MKKYLKSQAVALGNLRVNSENYITYSKKILWLMQSNIYGRPVMLDSNSYLLPEEYDNTCNAAVVSCICNALEMDGEYDQNILEFTKKKMNRDTLWTTPSVSRKNYRCMEKITDSKNLQKKLEKVKRRRTEKNPNILRNEKPYNCIDLAFMELMSDDYLEIFNVLSYKNITKERLNEAYKAYNQMIKKVNNIKDSMVYTMCCMFLYKFELAYRPTLFLKLAHCI